MKTRVIGTLLVLLAATAAATEKHEVIEKSFPATVGKVVLADAGPLDMMVRVADINEIRVKVDLVVAALTEFKAEKWLNAHRPTIEDNGGELRITAPDPKGIALFKGLLVTRARIELTVPPNVRPDLTTSSGSLRVSGEFPEARPLRLRTAAGDIELAGWAPEIEARSTSGDFALHASRAIDKLLVRSAGGSVDLSGGARDVRCDTSSGDVRMTGLLGPLVVTTTSGNITASFDAIAAGDAVRITTSSGRVRVTLPPGCEPGGELVTTHGEIRSSIPGTTSGAERRLALSGKGPTLSITTSSSRIELD
jgi:hypothetical protein